ncbi:hypothetical protein NEF87_002616 [Candidatus Lokiarchaeum ossiferum]|uniref:Transcription regulator AsnC/Lrp ligand binding domain-containing protein n=1 Tax=Candidatus Lokiarchaeum ossiferum TaxID=2951803 RepID=A0ABY6HS38_9ARCH|nr:hypothetical protein NEF87_002616 [Candidatus Lokiarchaeum sp. B-35]
MAKQNTTSQKIVLLSLCNVMWGLIPLPASKLFANYSTFLIIFARFLMMTIFTLGFILIFILYQQMHLKKKKKQSIKIKEIVSYLASKNVEFFNFPQWLYLLFLAVFGMNLMTILFFWGLKSVGVIITSIGVIFSLVVVTAVNWGRGKEEMSPFKALYLITLIGATVILGIISQNQQSGENQQFSWNTIGIIIAYGLTLSFFVISSSKDKMSPKEFTLLRINKNYRLIRTFLKLGILSFFASLTFIPLQLIFGILPLGNEISGEISRFFSEVHLWWTISWTGNGIILILICTIAPYFLYYFLAANWPKHTSFDLWVGVLQLIEPIINLILGVTILEENFPISWLVVIIFLMGIAIVTRYLSETEAQIFALFLLKTKPNQNKEAMTIAYSFKAVRQVFSLIGNYDLMLDVQLHSSQALNKFIQQTILSLPGLIEYDMLIITNTEMDRN